MHCANHAQEHMRAHTCTHACPHAHAVRAPSLTGTVRVHVRHQDGLGGFFFCPVFAMVTRTRTALERSLLLQLPGFHPGGAAGSRWGSQ